MIEENETKKDLISNLILDGEKDKSLVYLKLWAKEYGFKEVIFSILEPMLQKWGKLWMQGELSLAHGYLSGKIAEEFYLLASEDEDFKALSKIKKGKIVIGNIEDDFHPLGRKLVSIYSKAAGWDIIDLGNDVTADVFVEKALENNANIIAVSAMMFTTAKNVIKVRNEIEAQNLSSKIKLAVGGAVFKLRPKLVEELGCDGTAQTAIEAPILFENLMKQIYL
jgi:methanogenic corrinoid protein MtbC1